MPASGKVLEDSIRLSRIRRIKLALYAVQTAMLIALAFLLIVVMGGARIKPSFYLPIDSFTAVVVLLLLIICLESFFFRMLEIRFARSSSARHLMAKNSIKRSIAIAAVAGIFTIMLTMPSIIQAFEDSGKITTIVSGSTTPPSFYSSDPFSLSKAKEIVATSPRPVQIYLLDDEMYQDNVGNMSAMFAYRLNRGNYIVNERLEITVPAGEYVKYHIVLNDMDSPDTSATVEIIKEVTQTFTGIVSLFMISLVVANIAWIAYLIPIERKYAAGSIYK